MSGHFTLDELREFVRGHNRDEESLLLEHCRTCAECGDNLAAMLALTTARSSRRNAAANKYLWLAAAASLALVGVLAITVGIDVTDSPNTGQQLASLATTEPPAAFIVRFQLGALAPASAGDYIADLQSGGMLIANGDYEEAASVLRRIHAAAPDSRPIVATYLGIALYLAGDITAETGALLATSLLVGDEPISELGRWYFANHLLKVGEIAAAEEVLSGLTPEPTRYGKLAMDLLGEIQQRR